MQRKQPYPTEHQVEKMLKDYGVKPSADRRDTLRRELEKQREKFRAVDRVRDYNKERDLGR